MELNKHGDIVENDESKRPHSGRWKDPEIAKEGWMWLRCDDSGHYPGPEKCQMCLMKRPRYLHKIKHRIHGRMTVGRVCAGWLTGEDHAEKAEHELKLASRRKKDAERRTLENQISRGWKKSGSGWRASCQDGNVTVFPNNGGYQIRWARRGYDVRFGDETYSSVEAAKKAATRAMVKWILEGRKKALPEVEDWQ